MGEAFLMMNYSGDNGMTVEHISATNIDSNVINLENPQKANCAIVGYVKVTYAGYSSWSGTRPWGSLEYTYVHDYYITDKGSMIYEDYTYSNQGTTKYFQITDSLFTRTATGIDVNTSVFERGFDAKDTVAAGGGDGFKRENEVDIYVIDYD